MCIYIQYCIFLGHVLWGPKRNLNWRVLRSPWFAKVSRSFGALELVDLHIGLLPAVMDSKQTTALYLAKGTLGVVTCKFTTMSFFASYAPDKVVEVCEGNTSWDQRVTDWMSVHYTYVIRLYIMISVHPKIDPSLTHRVSSGFSHCLVIPESHNF